MGNQPSKLSYSVVASPEQGDISPVYRAASHPNELVSDMPGRTINNCFELFQHAVKTHGNVEFLGSRPLINGQLGPYQWKTYSEINTQVLELGSGIMNQDLCPEQEYDEKVYLKARSLRLLCVFCKNREEWFVAEQACNAFNLTIVPLYDSVGPEALIAILQQTRLETVFGSAECLTQLLKLSKEDLSGVKNTIWLEPPSKEQISEMETKGISHYTYQQLRADGKESPRSPAPGGRDDVQTICYTSGTTGGPKGVMLTQDSMVSTVIGTARGPLSRPDFTIGANDVHISYLPLSHVFERLLCNYMIFNSARIGIYSGDTLKLLEDLRALRPTIFISVPRLFNRVNDRINAGLREKSPIAQYLFASGLKTKIKGLKTKALTSHRMWDALVFNKTKALMGGRVRYMISGGAPLDASVQEKISCLLCAPLLEGYGMTETMGPCFVTVPADPLKGHVGGVFPNTEFRLVSVPEMNYHANDPSFPAGELQVRGRGICKGYFLNEEETRDTLNDEGWLKTGDVGVRLSNGAIKLIDRKKNIFKLSQGEYIAPEKIEGVYAQAGLVGQVIAIGDSTKSSLVGIVIPEEEQAQKWALRNNVKYVSLSEMCNNPTFKQAVFADMTEMGNQLNLKGFEKIKSIHLWPELCSVENGMLTPTFKLKRKPIETFFAKQVTEMYAKM